MDNEKLLIGAWVDAIGTIISAVSEGRALVGLNEINNKLVVIGEGMQAVGTLIIGTTETDNPLSFAGDWIDGSGAATSSYAAYLRDVDEENEEEAIRLTILGAALQSMGAAISSSADFVEGEVKFAFGNAVQSLGAGLEAIGGVYELNEIEESQLLATIGAIFQAIGSNYNAVLVTKEFIEKMES